MTSEGFFKASSNNLPSVDMFMVMEFIKNDERFNLAEIRGVKATNATREEYGDSAVGYVELKREGTLCIMQCKICPEHRVRAKNYLVCLTVDESEEKIIDVECKDCSASSGGCKHALAFLMWVHRRSEEPSPTQITSYWKKPRLATVGTSLKCVTTADFQKKTATPASSSQPSSFLKELTNTAEVLHLKGQVLQYSSATYMDTFAPLSLHKLLLQFSTDGGADVKDFLTFSNTKMTRELCSAAEKKTRAQADSPIWHELRFGRITASKLFEFANCKTAEGTLVESIIGVYKVKDTKFMKRGRSLELEVLKSVEQKMKSKFTRCGFFTLPTFPVFGASPDALSHDYVVEVKCPGSEKTFKNYVRDKAILNKYMAQIQMQMYCANKKKGLFCVAAPDFEISKNVEVFPIDFDENFLNKLMDLALENWKLFVFPKLFHSVQ